MLQTQYKIVHVCTGTYMHTVCAMWVVRDLMLCQDMAKRLPLKAYMYLYIYA